MKIEYLIYNNKGATAEANLSAWEIKDPRITTIQQLVAYAQKTMYGIDIPLTFNEMNDRINSGKLPHPKSLDQNKFIEQLKIDKFEMNNIPTEVVQENDVYSVSVPVMKLCLDIAHLKSYCKRNSFVVIQLYGGTIHQSEEDQGDIAIEPTLHVVSVSKCARVLKESFDKIAKSYPGGVPEIDPDMELTVPVVMMQFAKQYEGSIMPVPGTTIDVTIPFVK